MQLPNLVNIEFVHGCHMQCNFCPVRGVRVLRLMEDKTLNKIYDNLTTWQHPITILVSGRGEPTINPNFLEFMKTLRKLPNATIILETRSIKDHARIHVAKFVDVLNVGEENNPTPLYNYGTLAPRSPLRENCDLINSEFNVHWNGDVSICRFDWHGKAIVGNVHTSLMSTIWVHSERLNWSRKFLENRIRCPLPACQECDYPGERKYLIPNLSQADVLAMRKAWNLDAKGS